MSMFLVSLLSSVPVTAAPRGREGRDRDGSFVIKVLQQLKKAFGVTTTADGLTLPTP
jgi:hypothetical protein